MDTLGHHVSLGDKTGAGNRALTGGNDGLAFEFGAMEHAAILPFVGLID